MLYEIEKIELKEENGHEFLVMTTKPRDIYEEPRHIVVLNECTVNYYKECLKKCGSFEKLPIRWKILPNVVDVPVQLKHPILIKNNALGKEYETSVMHVLCMYSVDDELVASGNLKDAITWVKGWSPEERVHYYDDKTVYYICEGIIK